MGANSALRRLAKRALVPVLNERNYRVVQAVAKGWDIRFGKSREPEVELVPLAVRAGDAALDIGANFGLYSYHLSRAVGPRGKVYAFEPVPFTNQTLRIIARMLGLRNVKIVTKGCSDQSGKIKFSVPVQTSGALSTGQAYIGQRNDDHPGKEEQVRWESTKEIECEVVALDEFLPPLKNLSFIKCDIEGAELLAFRGAQKTISEHLPTVLLEINPWFLDGFGLKMEDLTGFFFDKGYELFHFGDGSRGLVPVTPAEIVEDNYIFVHPQRRERLASVFDKAAASTGR